MTATVAFLMLAGALLALTTGADELAVPNRPMIVHGNAVVDGKPPTLPIALEVSIDGQPLKIALTSRDGQAWYRLELPKKPAAPLRFVTLGDDDLGDLPAVTWQEGAVQRLDIVVGETVLPRPEVQAAAVSVGPDGWRLTCIFSGALGDVAPENAAFEVAWYLQPLSPPTPGAALPPATLLKHLAVPGTQAAKATTDSTVKPGPIDPAGYSVHLVITPKTVDGRQGPAAWRLVVPQRAAGEI